MALNRDGDYVPIDAVAGIAHVGAGALLGGAGGSFAERVDVVGRTDWRKWGEKGGRGTDGDGHRERTCRRERARGEARLL